MHTENNKVQLIGNLGKTPDIRVTEAGAKMARFSMATSEVYRDRTGRKETATTWHNIVAWGKVAELAEKMLTKGKEVAIEGKLVNRTYDDKNGNRRYITEVVANELMLMGSEERA